MLHPESEIRHEQCRYGTFAYQAFQIEPDGSETPIALPMCSFVPASSIPPRAVFALGGSIGPDECQKCGAYSPLTLDQEG